MNTCIVGGHKVELYGSIDEMPMANYHKFNKFLMFESGLAPDANGVIGHLAKMNEMLSAGENDKLRSELQNTYQAIYFIMEEVSPVSMAFVCMAHSIDGEVISDLSDENLRRLSYKLNRENVKALRNKVEELKKKLNTNSKRTLRSYFNLVRKRKQQTT